jgi:hypothetical protein
MAFLAPADRVSYQGYYERFESARNPQWSAISPFRLILSMLLLKLDCR